MVAFPFGLGLGGSAVLRFPTVGIRDPLNTPRHAHEFEHVPGFRPCRHAAERGGRRAREPNRAGEPPPDVVRREHRRWQDGFYNSGTEPVRRREEFSPEGVADGKYRLARCGPHARREHKE
jgi:hypothetical protein